MLSKGFESYFDTFTLVCSFHFGPKIFKLPVLGFKLHVSNHFSLFHYIFCRKFNDTGQVPNYQNDLTFFFFKG